MQSNPSPEWTHRAEAFGALLKARRTELGLSQRALAKHADLPSPHHISEIEQGKRKPGRPQLDRLCAVLGFDRDEAHALLGLIPLDVEEAWIASQGFRNCVRNSIAADSMHSIPFDAPTMLRVVKRSKE